MKVSLTKLVDVILEHVASSKGKVPTEKSMRSFLLRQGYTKKDIDSAIEIINTHLNQKPAYLRYAPPMRQLAFYESMKISLDVHHAITRLELLGLIEPLEREVLLERFIHADGQADMESLDYALSYLVGPGRNAETQQTMIAVLEGYSPTVH
ncbi:MAG: Protein Smg [Candidatus Hydrogenedentes bacterium ADurb.Bin101]|jgi:uncharacterized protein Smg (DUF494 family)|nr:MAG: Protein Smg [Candidatus Hydrogenedentes bacterium ADurb.Bin101]HOC70067.1 DUF494 family protein [Candidatus Hydrogenedentota bacterium]